MQAGYPPTFSDVWGEYGWDLEVWSRDGDMEVDGWAKNIGDFPALDTSLILPTCGLGGLPTTYMCH